MTRRISVELPERMIHQIDKVGSDTSLFDFTFFGLRQTRSLKLQSLLDQAFEAQFERKQNAQETPTLPAPVLKPLKHLPDYAPVDKETLDLPLTRRTIDGIGTEALTALVFDNETAHFAQDADLRALANLTPAQLSRKLALSIVDANRLALAFEFARRVARSYTEREKITAPCDVADILMPKLRYLQHEVVVCLALDTKGHVTDNLLIAEESNADKMPTGLGNYIGHQRIFEGTLNASVFHPREIFRYAIDTNANSIVLAHNHPSGDPQPSQEDIRATKQLIEAGNHIGIKVLDHIVIGDGIFVSLKEEGFI